MTVHEQWLRDLEVYKERLLTSGLRAQLPPPSMLELKLEYLDIRPGVSMKAKLPFQQRFTNPVGLYQGGFLAAGFDDVFGPLSYVTAGVPCMTLSLNLTFLRAFTGKLDHVIIEGKVLQKTKTLIFMRAEALTPDGEILAHAESHVSIMREDQMRKA